MAEKRKSASASPTHKAAGLRLTPAAIVAEALGFADAEGLAALTMRALAARLGVEAMAIYHHFPSKDALLDAMTERLETEARPPSDGTNWRERLTAIAKHQIKAALAHPRVASLMTSRRGATPAVFANNEDVLRALKEAGLDAKSRVIWLRAFAAFVNGLAQYLIALQLRSGGAPAIDERNYPLVAAAARLGSSLGPEAVLDAGLGAFYAAIERDRRRQ